MRRHGDSCTHLHKCVTGPDAKTCRKTIRKWINEKTTPESVESFDILARIERRYQLPAGYFRGKLTSNARAPRGKPIKGISAAEQRRLAWHLPSDFPGSHFASLWASERSMASGLHRPDSLSRVDAVVRSPCAVTCANVNPMRRNARFIVFSHIGRRWLWKAGNIKPSGPVCTASSRKRASTSRDSGTEYGRRIFMRSAGIDQTAPSQSMSDQTE
ncbi:hypothetical protein ATE62_08715 [Sphingopyxis sp. HIX]|nr:hypothetical protein ATE62_08715 [Sphingopyxis sp. HIX]